jgi:hypothetical protein
VGGVGVGRGAAGEEAARREGARRHAFSPEISARNFPKNAMLPSVPCHGAVGEPFARSRAARPATACKNQSKTQRSGAPPRAPGKRANLLCPTELLQPITSGDDGGRYVPEARTYTVARERGAHKAQHRNH